MNDVIFEILFHKFTFNNFNLIAFRRVLNSTHFLNHVIRTSRNVRYEIRKLYNMERYFECIRVGHSLIKQISFPISAKVPISPNFFRQ